MSAEVLNEAVALLLQGQLNSAWERLQHLAPHCAQTPEYWFWLAWMAWQTGHPAETSACLQTLTRSWQGSLAEALWRQIPPEEGAMVLALLLGEEARNAFEPDFWRCLLDDLEAHFPLEDALLARLWRFELERDWKSQAELEAELHADPTWIEGWHLLAAHQLMQGQSAAARQTWQDLRQRAPHFLPAQVALGHLALQAGQVQAALDAYQGALAVQPQQPELHYQLGRLYLSVLEPERAREHLHLANQQDPGHPLRQLQEDLAYPPLVETEAEAQALLQRLQRVAQARQQSIPLQNCLADLARGGMEPLFDLNYLGPPEEAVRSDFADIFILPQAPRWSERSAEALHLGVLVTPGHEGLFLFGSRVLLAELVRAGLQVRLFCFPASAAAFRVWTQQAGVQLEVLPHELKAAIAQVQARGCDLIYYWESGTDPLNYFLPFFQLAPVQLTSWGSVATTGNPRMQAFLSTPALDPPGNEAYYREHLLRLPALPLLYGPGMLVAEPHSRLDLGLPAEGMLLGSPHNPLKYSLAYLQAVKAILEQVPSARLVLMESRHPTWTGAVRQRVERVLGAQVGQVIWRERLPAEVFLALCQHLDLVLDPFPYGAGKLAFECLGLGVPMLTCPGRRLRGRIVAAAYAQMGHTRLVAADPQAYVKMAVALLHDPLALQAHREVLQLLRPRLQQHPAVLPGLLSALAQLAEGSQR